MEVTHWKKCNRSHKHCKFSKIEHTSLAKILKIAKQMFRNFTKCGINPTYTCRISSYQYLKISYLVELPCKQLALYARYKGGICLTLEKVYWLCNKLSYPMTYYDLFKKLETLFQYIHCKLLLQMKFIHLESTSIAVNIQSAVSFQGMSLDSLHTSHKKGFTNQLIC